MLNYSVLRKADNFREEEKIDDYSNCRDLPKHKNIK